TRANYEPNLDDALKVEGTVLAGGTVQVDRKLGLILRPEFGHAKMSAKLADAVNRRFFFFDGTTRRGIAKAVEDDFIEIDLHPRYRENVYRLMEVVRSTSPKPDFAHSQQRLSELAQRLANPATAADAALQLESIGDSAIPVLLEGIQSPNPELRFYAAEALAYLDRVEAVAPLEEAIREVAAFRHDALLALQELKRPESAEALKRLINEQSLETRYGAFCALRQQREFENELPAQRLGAVNLYRVASDAPPAVVISLRRRAEVVLFGNTHPLQLSGFLRRSSGLMLMNDPTQQQSLKISRFRVGEEDRRQTTDTSLASVVEGISSVGGDYGDIVEVLRIAKERGYLVDQLAFDPLPRPLRTYYRDEHPVQPDDEASAGLASAEDT
ncbi:MAG: HEAT repeat domain-containing protein, partial [Pirellulales bacterium]|nr:HEAT repeat domain-containing protein [Pirellulales bacterium]